MLTQQYINDMRYMIENGNKSPFKELCLNYLDIIDKLQQELESQNQINNGLSEEAFYASAVPDLETEIKELKETLKPFAHPDLSKLFSNNVKGDESIVFQKNEAKLKIGDFRKAKELLDEKTEITKN